MGIWEGWMMSRGYLICTQPGSSKFNNENIVVEKIRGWGESLVSRLVA